MPENQVVDLTCVKMQQQNGIDDCGLFSLASVLALCNNMNLAILNFKQNTMRVQYNHFVKSNNFAMFDHKKSRRFINCVSHTFNI